MRYYITFVLFILSSFICSNLCCYQDVDPDENRDAVINHYFHII